MVKDIKVRNYEKRDLDCVNVLLKEAFSCEKINFQDNSFHEIVLTVDDEIAGYLLLTKVLNPIKNRYYYLIDYVCISSSYRGMGLGEQLLDYAEEVAREDEAMYLQLSCSRFRLAAHKLYEKCNYVKRDSDIYRKEII